MEALLHSVTGHHGIVGRRGVLYAGAQADTVCASALQLGWHLCRDHLLSQIDCPQRKGYDRLSAVSKWFIAEKCRRIAPDPGYFAYFQ